MAVFRLALSDRFPAPVRRPARYLALGLFSVALSGCGAINNLMYKTTGDVMQGFAGEHTVPYLLESQDLVMACAMSEATAPLMMSFGRVTDEPDQLAVMLNLSAAGCEEERAWERELVYLRAIGEQNGRAAQDAQIAQKRHQRMAAQRYLRSWEHLQAHYGEAGDGNCPDFDDRQDEFIYMAGLLAGLQALSNEIQSGVPVGVPKNIGSKVERAAACLADDDWWGVPMAMRATVWAMIPGAEPAGENAFERLRAADLKGEKAGVRLAHVFHAMAAVNAERTDEVKAVIRAHADAIGDRPDPEWRMVDEIATRNIQAISDRLWTQNQGHRTPIGELGTFWDDRREPVGETVDLEGIL
jgi:hypothetical protein